jgi:hypothetical protein
VNKLELNMSEDLLDFPLLPIIFLSTCSVQLHSQFPHHGRII